MKVTYDLLRIHDDNHILYFSSEGYGKNATLYQTFNTEFEAHDTAREWAWASGGMLQVVERHNGKIVKVTQYESDGFITGEEGYEIVDIKVILELAK